MGVEPTGAVVPVVAGVTVALGMVGVEVVGVVVKIPVVGLNVPVPEPFWAAVYAAEPTAGNAEPPVNVTAIFL